MKTAQCAFLWGEGAARRGGGLRWAANGREVVVGAGGRKRKKVEKGFQGVAGSTARRRAETSATRRR